MKRNDSPMAWDSTNNKNSSCINLNKNLDPETYSTYSVSSSESSSGKHVWNSAKKAVKGKQLTLSLILKF